MKILLILLLLLSGISCSYKAQYDPGTNTLTSNAKGKYKYESKEESFEAKFGQPLIDLSGASPKIEKD